MDLALPFDVKGFACDNLPLVRGSNRARTSPRSPVRCDSDGTSSPLRLPHTPKSPDSDGTCRACGSPRDSKVSLEAEVVCGAISGDGANVGDAGLAEGVERRVVLDDVVLDPWCPSNPSVDRKVGIAGVRKRSAIAESTLVLDRTACISAEDRWVMKQRHSYLV